MLHLAAHGYITFRTLLFTIIRHQLQLVCDWYVWYRLVTEETISHLVNYLCTSLIFSSFLSSFSASSSSCTTIQRVPETQL